MEVSAKLRHVRQSAQKCRLMADQVRGMDVEKALHLLEFSPKKSSDLIKKVLNSAIANAEENHSADIDLLRISIIHVNEGPTLKRWRARAKGRANQILKRTCHITVWVTDEEAA